MLPEFRPAAGAAGWAVSNPPIFSAAPLIASLDMFRAAGIEELRAKSLRLTAYAERLLRERVWREVQIITPADPEQRGCQLSLRMSGGPRRGRRIFDALGDHGIVCDWREPDIIRIAPTPLLQPLRGRARARGRTRRRAQGNYLSLTSAGGVNVIGAGLAGSLLAILLARRGLRVTVYERRADPRHFDRRLRPLHQPRARRARHPRVAAAGVLDG